MIPVVTAAEMRAIDAATEVSTEVLVERAGAAVARAAKTLLGGCYGRRVVVVAGPGNNGADGRAAARRLRAAGCAVEVVEATVADAVERLPTRLRAGGRPADLLIDAAFGTGFRGVWRPPAVAVPVLAVDLPSGVRADDGTAGGSRPWPAVATVTFHALKPVHVLAAGRAWCGEIHLAGIGLDGRAHLGLVEDGDVSAWWPRRSAAAHKWTTAVRIVAGSAGMTGAAVLAASAAARAGAGMVQLASPAGWIAAAPAEIVQLELGAASWGAAAATDAARIGALVVGPGLGRAAVTAESVIELLTATAQPVVVDGDGLQALAAAGQRVIAARPGPVVLTPHDGEYAALLGEPPGPDRVAAARLLAAELGALIVLKGPTTIVATPAGEALAVVSGDERLATAGTGDVLSGTIAAVLAHTPAATVEELLEPVAAAAHAHGIAGRLAGPVGVIAGDVVAALPAALDSLGVSG